LARSLAIDKNDDKDVVLT